MTINHFINTISKIEDTFNLSHYALIRISGADATTFLQGQMSCDINQLNETLSLPGAYCDPKGRMIATFWIWREDDTFCLILPKNNRQNFLEKIAKFAAFSKVHLEPIENQYITGIIGPCDNYTMKLPGKIERYIKINNQSTAKESALWQACNIATGLCDIDINTSGLFTPQMINLEKFDGVSFTKGCFVGQEIIARTQHLGKLKRHLQTLTSDNALTVQSGDMITNDNHETVGTVTEYYVSDKSYLLAVIEDRALTNSLFVNNNQRLELEARTV